MSEYFEITNASKPTFGDYVTIEMKRYGVPNEYFIHEVLTQPFISNSWRVVPIVSSQKETLHKTTEAVISVRSSSGLPIFNVRVCDILPMVGDKWCWKESPLRTRIAELEEKQRWRVVADGELPDNWKPVLTIDMSESVRVPVPAFYDPETSLWSTHFPYDLWVTHWMPLPELPEESK